MSDFDLYYWPVPFRGQFIRAILAYGGRSWDEHDSSEIGEMMERDAGQQPIAFMGAPILIDRERDFAISQMPAIALYLGERLDLLPNTAEGRALTTKIINDANDVIDELTLDGGREMWTDEKWKEFVPRLRKWMLIFEDTGHRNGLTRDTGYILGTNEPGIADIVTATLWATMSDRFPAIDAIFKSTAPIIHGLSKRMQAMPSLIELNKSTLDKYGDQYCGGQIERSLRKVAG